MSFLLLTISGWDEPPRARHQVARALAKHERVFFVARNQVGPPGVTIRDVEPGITLVQPSWPLDYRYRSRLPIVNDLYQDWLLRNLSRQFAESRVITFDHTVAALSKRFPDYIYFCNDDFIGNSTVKSGIVDRYHRWTESRVARGAKTIFATSPYLVRKLMIHNDDVHELPLGAPWIDDETLERCRTERSGEGLHLGLVGFMGRRTPVGLINRLLELDGARLTLIGPADPNFIDRIDSKRPVRVLGVVTGHDLLREISGFDVGIAPYDPAYVNRGGTPNKIWQYLAMGRPAVVTSLPNIEHWTFPEGCLYVAQNEDEFVELVQRAASEDSELLAKRRIAVARDNTWDRRIDRMLNHSA